MAFSALITSGTVTIYDLVHFPVTLVIQSALYLLWSMGLFISCFQMGKQIIKGKVHGLKNHIILMKNKAWGSFKRRIICMTAVIRIGSYWLMMILIDSETA